MSSKGFALSENVPCKGNIKLAKLLIHTHSQTVIIIILIIKWLMEINGREDVTCHKY